MKSCQFNFICILISNLIIGFSLHRKMKIEQRHPQGGTKEAAIAKSQCVSRNIVNAIRFEFFYCIICHHACQFFCVPITLIELLLASFSKG